MLLGCNVHLGYKSYADNQPGELALVTATGFTLIRENVASAITLEKATFGSSVKVLGVPGNGAVATAMLKAGADYLEGPNELFTDKKQTVAAPIPTNPNATRLMTQSERAAYCIKMWNQVYAAREAWTVATGIRIPLGSPSASNGDAADALAVAKLMGKLANQPDFQSIHAYPGNRTVLDYQTEIRQVEAIADILAPGKDRWLTELGTWWNDDPAVRAGANHPPTAPADAVTLWPKYLAMVEAEGFKVAMIYELKDETGKIQQEGNFGVYFADLTPKLYTPVLIQEAHTRNGVPMPVPTPPPAPTPPPVVVPPAPAPVPTTPTTPPTPAPLPPAPTVTGLEWAVAILPDSTDRWKAVQTAWGTPSDGKIGSASLAAAELFIQQAKANSDKAAVAAALAANQILALQNRNNALEAGLQAVNTAVTPLLTS